MTSEEWSRIKHFSSQEFDSPDLPGSGIGMQLEFMLKLDQLRNRLGQPLQIVSGIRSPIHNAEVGGVDGSAHVGGYAADVYTRASMLRYKILYVALSDGLFRRIGVGKSFIHLDCDPTKPQDVVWLYS